MSTIVYNTNVDVVDLSEAGRAKTMFDGLLETVEDMGAITWTTITHNIAIGRYKAGAPQLVGYTGRIAIFDLDTANGLEVIHTVNWINGNTDVYPTIAR